MATYEQMRDNEYSARLDAAIEAFAHQFKRDTKSERKTVILFPGGVASQLARSRYRRNRPRRAYRTAWLEFSVLCGAFADLAFESGGLIDKDERYIVPDGPVDFFPGVQPYVGFEQWCAQNWIHLFVFGWDWRRPMPDSANFFLEVFMPKFEEAFRGCRPHPLDNLTLIGHSAGGMLLKIIANNYTNAYVAKMRKAITVATPFYGYGALIHKLLVGDPDINRTVSPPNPTSKVIRWLSGMPASYEYHYLDHGTYLANRTAFTRDPDGFNLLAYPSMDRTVSAEVADPYNPTDSSGLVRYPKRLGFSDALLGKGLETSNSVSSPFPVSGKRKRGKSVRDKFFNIRGVQTRSGKATNGTVISQVWRRVPKKFNPEVHADPITDKQGPGDGVQPAWTTRLIGLPRGHVITVYGGEVEHSEMMNHRGVQRHIAELIGLDMASVEFLPVEKVRVARRTELDEFLDKIGTMSRKDIATYVDKLDREFLHSLLARAHIDALKSPTRKLSARRRKGPTSRPPDKTD
jgi:hypothetical protein